MKLIKLWVPILSASLLMTGCVTQQTAPVVKVEKPVKKVKAKKRYKAPKAPKKNIKLKEVEDENFSSEYMYPKAKKQEVAKVKEPVAYTEDINPAISSMSNGECIAMIGQEKFDKYSQMYGGSSAALKKCKMLKAM